MYSSSTLPVSARRLMIGLQRRRWRAVAAAWGAAALIWLAVLIAPQSYESRAHVYADLAPFADDVGLRDYYRQRVDAMGVWLLARPQLEKIVARAGLDASSNDQSPDDEAEDRRLARMDRLTARVADGMTVESPAAAYLVISHRDRDPETARALVEAALAVLMEGALTEEETDARPASDADDQSSLQALTQRIAEHERKLAENDEAIAALKRAQESNAGETADAGRADAEASPAAALPAVTSPADALQRRAVLRQADSELASARARMTDLLNRAAAAAPGQTGGEVLRLRLRLSELRRLYPDGAAGILTTEARIARLERDAALAGNMDYLRLQTELQGALDAVTVLKARRDALRAALSAPRAAPAESTPPAPVGVEPAAADPVAAADLQKLENDQRALKSAHAALLSLREETPPAASSPIASPIASPSARAGVSFRVVEPPRTASAPSGPSRLPLVVGGFFLAVAAGLTAAAAASAFDDRLSDVAALKNAVGRPVLGSVGTAPSAAVVASGRRDRARLAAACLALVLAAAACAYLAASQSFGAPRSFVMFPADAEASS